MTITDELQSGEHRPTGVGPGERLQAARIQQGLSLDDVASRMHLSANVLKAIEENDFGEIIAPIFVKGYLRAYARIVSLDEDEMIQLYLDLYSEEDPPIMSTSSMAPELSVDDARIKSTTYLVVVGLAILLAAWWWNKDQGQNNPISLEAQAPLTELEAIAAREELVSSGIEAVSESEVEPAIASESSLPGESISEREPAVTNSRVEVETTSDEAVPALITEKSLGTEMAAPPQVLASTDLSGLLLTRLAPSGSDKLIIVIHADTWADIKDGADHQMAYDLLRANQTLNLTGEAPFSVFLGNGHGVEIQFNGEDVEIISQVRDDNTARLNIGG